MRELREVRPYVREANFSIGKGISLDGRRIGYFYAFHLMTDGEGYVKIDDRRYSAQKGAMFFIPPGTEYSIEEHHKFPLTSYNLYCDIWPGRLQKAMPILTCEPGKIDERYMTLVEDCPDLRGMCEKTSLLPLHFLTDSFIQIVKIFNESQQYKEEIVNALLYSWILLWHNHMKSPKVTDYRIQAVIAQMEQSSGCNLSYKDWLQMCGLKKTHFYTLFKEETGLSPKEFMFKLKMRKAQDMLTESGRVITTIAEMLGYSSVHYFSSQFTSCYGITPSEFRKRYASVDLKADTEYAGNGIRQT